MKLALVAEDNADIRDATVQLLENEGLQVIAFKNGKLALEYLLGESNERPSVIFSDVSMPKLDGIQFRIRMLAQDGLSKIPFYLLSARGEVHEDSQGLQLSGVLMKPLSSDVIVDVLQDQSLTPARVRKSGAPRDPRELSHELINEIGIARMHAELASTFAELSPQVKNHLAKIESKLNRAIALLRS